MSSFYISALVVLFGMAAGLTRDYVYVNVNLSWPYAKDFCTQVFKSLAHITTDEEYQRLLDVAGKVPSGWTGMYRSQVYSPIWLWDDGTQSSFFKWKLGEPNNVQGNENCVQMMPGGWNDFSCSQNLTFYCTKIYVLVNEKKTWEEALDYCRKNYANLVSPASNRDLQLAEKECNQTQTDSVWTGLRFLDGKWLWANRQSLGNLVSLPSCPAAPYRCGARNIKTHVWENRDCNEKLNFVCYK